MPATKIGLEQIKRYDPLSELAPSGDILCDELIENINDKLKEPGSLKFNGGDAILHVGPTVVEVGPNGKQKSLPQLAGIDIGDISGTVDFTGNPNLTVTGDFATGQSNISLSSGEFVKAGIEIRADKKLYVVFGTPNTTVDTAGEPSFSKKSIPLGYVVLENNGTSGVGNVLNRTNAHIYEFGSGGGAGGSGIGIGAINYIENSDFENNIDGWFAYNDGGSTPVDMIGGTISVDFFLNKEETTPLIDNASLKVKREDLSLTLVGHGVATETTIIQSNERHKFFQVRFYYKTVSTTLLSGNLKVHAYDITNSALIKVFPQDLPITNGSIKEYKGIFKISPSTERVRIGLHIANDSPYEGFDLYLDNVFVGIEEDIDSTFFITETVTAISLGNVVAFDTTKQSAVTLATRTSAELSRAIGIACHSANPNQPVKIKTSGVFGGYTGLTPGAQYYLGTSGAITASEPSTYGDYKVKVGIALDANTIFINPDLSTNGEQFTGLFETYSSIVSITSGGTITLGTAFRNTFTNNRNRILRVQGSGGPITTSSTPFTTTAPGDGTVIILVGSSNANTVTIPYANVPKGCWINGDCTLANGSTLTLVYSQVLDRYLEIGRANTVV